MQIDLHYCHLYGAIAAMLCERLTSVCIICCHAQCALLIAPANMRYTLTDARHCHANMFAHFHNTHHTSLIL
jgi:hypothetical protein